MSSSLVIEIKVPLASASVFDQAEVLAPIKGALADLIAVLPAGSIHTTRIVTARSDAGQPRPDARGPRGPRPVTQAAE